MMRLGHMGQGHEFRVEDSGFIFRVKGLGFRV
jgi:hypothetical protein